jgi:hypothetical protein
MLLYGVYAEPKDRYVDKGRIGQINPADSEERADIEFNLIDTTLHARSPGNGVFEMAVGGTNAFGNENWDGRQTAQANGQSSCGNPSRYVDGMDGDPTGSNRLVQVRHLLISCESDPYEINPDRVTRLRPTQRSLEHTIQGRGYPA